MAITALLCLSLAASAGAQTTERQLKIAILSFGDSVISRLATERLASNLKAASIMVLDYDQAQAAARGAGYTGSLNLSLDEARDLGAAIGCDFFITGEAQTLRRSPSEGPIYFESYASIFLVSARTGKLVLWERPEFRGATPGEAEPALLTSLGAAETRQRHTVTIRRALEDERQARVRAVEVSTPVIEVMTDDQTGTNVRAPRPYRRLKPPYPSAAANVGLEATVDVLVDVDEKGEVGRLEIARWAGYGLDQSVIETVRQMHFFPAMRDGSAIPMRVLLRYNFRKPPD